MKKLTTPVVALVLFVVPVAVAQHGRGVGGGHGMGHATQPESRSGGPTRTDQRTTATPSDRLAKNTKLAANLEKLLPSGMTAQQACTGFKNLGQCVAAVHVSHNLGISFADLKAKMLGTAASGTNAGTKPMSLGGAIHALAPNADAKKEANKANAEAKEDLKTSA